MSAGIIWLLLILGTHICLLVVMVMTHTVLGYSYGGSLWLIAVLIPIAGPAAALALLLAEHDPYAGLRSQELEGGDVAAETETLPVVDDEMGVARSGDAATSAASSRRELMLDALLEGGESMEESLALARSSGDPEIAHYASSASMGITNRFEEEIAQVREAFRQSPGDVDIMGRYIELLEHYLSSGAVEGRTRELLERRYRALLMRKVELGGTEADLRRLAQSQLDAGLYADASHTLSRAEHRFPDQDETWLLRLRYWYGLKRADKVREMVRGSQGEHVSAAVRTEIDFWEQVDS